jgi:cardiolipin synthase A/B
MFAAGSRTQCEWLSNGREVFPAMLAAVDGAQQSIYLESYIYSPAEIGQRFREALVRARHRGVHVRVLVDGLGSYSLPSGFWAPLEAVGGEARIFNPISLHRLSIRNHRKLLVCDERVAFIGGFNIAPEYDGDGVSRGWCDIGLRIEGPLAERLSETFREMFARAEFRHKRFARLRRFGMKRVLAGEAAGQAAELGPEALEAKDGGPNMQTLWSTPASERLTELILLGGPGRERSPIKRALHRDLRYARSVQIMVAYFLPSWHVRRQLVRIARSGGRVQLLLAGKSDVTLSLLAGQSLYRRLLKEGVEVFEYQPQILHAKLFILDDVVYVGSANLDPRSLHINYELMIRFNGKEMATHAREVFESKLKHCRQLNAEGWRRERSFWRRLEQRVAYLLLARLDPYIALRQWRALPD